MMDGVTGEEVGNIPCDARFEQDSAIPTQSRIAPHFTAVARRLPRT